MKVAYSTMVMAKGDTRETTFCAHVANLRWTNRARGKWSGRIVSEPLSCFTLTGDSTTACRRMDEAEDALAARLGIPAAHRVFPRICPPGWDL